MFGSYGLVYRPTDNLYMRNIAYIWLHGQMTTLQTTIDYNHNYLIRLNIWES